LGRGVQNGVGSKKRWCAMGLSGQRINKLGGWKGRGRG
jgi:hypothetical protein